MPERTVTDSSRDDNRRSPSVSGRYGATVACLMVIALVMAGCGASPVAEATSPDVALATPTSALREAPAAQATTAVLVAPSSPDRGHHPGALSSGMSSPSVPLTQGLRVEPGTHLFLGWVADRAPITLVADGQDVSWHVSGGSQTWLRLNRTTGVLKAGTTETLEVRVDRMALRRSIAADLGADASTAFAGLLWIQTATGQLQIEVTGREAAQSMLQCSPGGRPGLDLLHGADRLVVREQQGRCVDWYVAESPAWLGLDVTQTGLLTGDARARGSIVDANRRQRPFTTPANGTTEIEVTVDWRRVPPDSVVSGPITLVEASRDEFITVIAQADGQSRTFTVAMRQHDAATE